MTQFPEKVYELAETDPRAAVRELLGIELDPSIEVVVLQNTETVQYLVLPEVSMSDEELRGTAAGTQADALRLKNLPIFGVLGGRADAALPILTAGIAIGMKYYEEK